MLGDDPVGIKISHFNSLGTDTFEQMVEKAAPQTVFEKNFVLEPGEVLMFSTLPEAQVEDIRMFCSFQAAKSAYIMDTVLIDALAVTEEEVLDEVVEDEEVVDAPAIPGEGVPDAGI